MIEGVDGEIYHFYVKTQSEAAAVLQNFFATADHQNDLAAVNGLSAEPIYVSANDQTLGMFGNDCTVSFTENIFLDARRNRHLVDGGVILALNEEKEPVCLLKKSADKTYFHDYNLVNEEPDTRVFSLYDTVVLMNVTEYAFILLRDALVDFKGRIICIGPAWLDFACFFSDRNNIEYMDNLEDNLAVIDGSKTMYLAEFMSNMNGWRERCDLGFYSYDEMMYLVYFFSIRKPGGYHSQNKKYYIVNPVFPMEGLMSICDKVQTPCAYAEANGFIPVVNYKFFSIDVFRFSQG